MKRKHLNTIIMAFILVFMLSSCSLGKVNNVINKIDKLGVISEATGQQLQEIEQSYNELTDEQKQEVTNYEKYLTVTKEYESYMRVLHVKNTIDSVSEVSLDTKNIIDEIKEDYAELSEDEKNKVDNYGRLEELEAEFEQFIKSTIADVVDDLDWYEYEARNSKADDLFTYYDYMTDEQKRECLARYLFYTEAPDYVQEVLKDSLKNPSSFTVYDMEVDSVITYDEDDGIFTGWIDITYGGTNSFGAMVKESETIWVDFSVNIRTKNIYFEEITIWGF